MFIQGSQTNPSSLRSHRSVMLAPSWLTVSVERTASDGAEALGLGVGGWGIALLVRVAHHDSLRLGGLVEPS
jgi:hypothetical protein